MSAPSYEIRNDADTFIDDLFAFDQSIEDMPDDPVGWIERYFFIPENTDPENKAIKLQDYQKQVITQALKKNNDNFQYSTILYSDLKKSAKSTIAAAVVLWMAWHHEWETCRVVGNDLKQADSRTFYYIRRAIELNANLRAVCKVKNYTIELPNHTKIEAVPVDPKGEAGGGDLIVCFTELWAAKNSAAQQMWTETTLSPLKYGKSLRWCESYAGYVGESPILEQLYDQGVKQGKRIDEDLELFESKEARLLAFWNTRPRCDWQTADYYAQEQALLAPNEFNRIHRNQWGEATQAFVPSEWWDACYRPELPPLTEYTSLVVGIDAGVTSDCFGILAVSRHGDAIAVRFVRKWIPPHGGKLAFSNPNNKDDMELPEGVVRWLSRTYYIEEFAYDEYQLADFANRQRADDIGWFNAFSQGSDRAVADKQLYDLIREGRIMHDDNPDLHEHILNADRQAADNGKLRLVKRKPEMKIDLAVCLSMASYEALRLNLGS